MIEIKRWFWNDKEVTLEEYNQLNDDWKRMVEETERLNSEEQEKLKRKKK
jgi:uncharacterized protein YdcH (DUF465 family)